MVRKQPFTWCRSCGNWAYNFRIGANGGRCGKCHSHVDLFKKDPDSSKGKGKGGGKVPREKPTPWGSPAGCSTSTSAADPVEMLRQLAALPALSGSLSAIQAMESTTSASLIKPRSPQEEANHTRQILQRRGAALRRAADVQVAAEMALAKAEDEILVVTEEASKAKEAHDKAVAELSRSLGPSVSQEGYAPDGKKILLAYHDADFTDNLDDNDENQQTLRDLKAQMDNRCQRVAALHATLPATLKTVKEIRTALRKAASLHGWPIPRRPRS